MDDPYQLARFVQAQDDKSGVNLVSAVFISPKRLARIGVALEHNPADAEILNRAISLAQADGGHPERGDNA